MKNKTVVLETAVFEVIETFVNEGKSFSIYDVTKEIRKRANSEMYVFEDLTLDEDNKYSIDHSLVKTNFEWIALINPSVHDLELTVSQGPNYRIFTPKDAVAKPVKSIKPMIYSSKFTSDIADKIESYLTGKFRSVKQVQSRLRREGNFTCDEILDFLDAKGWVDLSNYNGAVSKVMANV